MTTATTISQCHVQEHAQAGRVQSGKVLASSQAAVNATVQAAAATAAAGLGKARAGLQGMGQDLADGFQTQWATLETSASQTLDSAKGARAQVSPAACLMIVDPVSCIVFEPKDLMLISVCSCGRTSPYSMQSASSAAAGCVACSAARLCGMARCS